MENQYFEEWALLELMGHSQLAGKVSEQVIGSPMIRIDIPNPDESIKSTQFYSPSSVYCITPISKELALQLAQSFSYAPISRFELPGHQDIQDHSPEEDDFNDLDS